MSVPYTEVAIVLEYKRQLAATPNEHQFVRSCSLFPIAKEISRPYAFCRIFLLQVGIVLMSIYMYSCFQFRIVMFATIST